ncbi:MAG: iron-containing alcohol dehydrogenase [Corallococcus sp.]|nr:iron-containing alcohol dehydrogenase [Corallococcus sp.]MCM1359629.1 iron-containing alcohol dehydrogenase [Corallococcus sp.]MCM1395221.1 iron-containing alcohol dehydrogenase [Corallococcus sp.]
MNVLKKAWCRIYQKVLYVGMAFMPWRKPELLCGEGSFAGAVGFLRDKGVTRPLVVCDKAALERRALDGFFDNARGVLQYAVFDGVLPNPTVEQAEQGLKVYCDNNCNGILAFGGGSALDCAKAIGARVVRPKKTVNQLKGLLKVRKKLPPFFAVPTTAGTGSECTLAAVITDGTTHDKYAINDFSLIPHYAILDASLTVGLPPMLTATTGMDALTHAVEAYVGRSNTRSTKRNAEQAVKLVFDNLLCATQNGGDISARTNMQRAAYLAGLAFTRAYVGYVHALAHALGGKYGTPHGLANAVLLPKVLQKYGKSAHKKLAKLAKAVGLAEKSDSREQSAQKFIDAVVQLNKDLGIPDGFGGTVVESDVKELARHAEREANPLYPVPQLWTEREFEEIYLEVM